MPDTGSLAMSDARKDIEAMHAAYVRGTGLDVRMDMAREIAWYEVWRRGIRAQDIDLVIAHMKRKAKAQRTVRSFTFRNFVGNADYLEEDILEAKAANRIPRPHPGRAAVLQATGRPAAPEPPPSKSVGEILSNEQILSGLAKLKEEL